MNKKFCQICNGATYYEDELPNACCKCGNIFAGVNLASIEIPTKPVRKLVAKKPIEDEYEDENEESPIEIGTFEIEVDIPKRQIEKIGVLAADNGPKEKIMREKLKINKKEIAENFKNELARKPSQEISLGGMSGD